MLTPEVVADSTKAEALQIAGLVPFSTVDWPGKIVAALFLQGCPWRCPYCHNASILDPRAPGMVEWDEVRTLLARRSGLLDGVVFSGGEALMQGAGRTGQSPLEAAMFEVREMGFEVGLHAAGAYPARLEDLVDKDLVDWVGLDVKALPADYALATGLPAPKNGGPSVGSAKVEQSLEILADSTGVDWEVRLTLWPALASGTALAGRATADGLIDYAVKVAKWSYERGARKFALQRYRVPPWANPKSSPDVAATDPAQIDPLILDVGALWEDQDALEALSRIGFEEVSVR